MSTPFDSPTEFQPAPRRRVWPFVLSGCAVLGLLMLAACGGMLYFGYRQVSGNGEVAAEVDRLFDEIAQGRAAQFYRDWCSPELKRATSQQEFVDFANAINEQLGKLVSKSVTGFSFNRQNLTSNVEASYTCEFERGKATVQTRFVQKDGRWLLQSFQVLSPRLLKPTARRKCPFCGELYEPGDKFCPHCGKQLPDTPQKEAPDQPAK